MNNNDDDKPATKRDLREAVRELKAYVLDRETALIWKVVILKITLIGAMTGGFWVAINVEAAQVARMLQHSLK